MKKREGQEIKMKRLNFIVVSAIAIAIMCLVTSCYGTTEQTSKNEKTDAPLRKVIIDTDAGADDASAIIYAARSGRIDLLGVTVCTGNVEMEQAGKNVLMALEMAGLDAGVYPGALVNSEGERIEAFSVFGSDGMGDVGLVDPKGSMEEKDAVDFILETVSRYPDEVEIITLGSTTNIAKAIEKDPKTMRKTKRIWSMGTTGLGSGNASPVAEFNVYSDAAAYKTMLNSGIDITIIGLDMCGDEAQWTDEQFDKLEKTNDIGRFVAASFGKLREFYASNGSADSVMNCDTLAVMCALQPDFVKDTVLCHASCITKKGEDYAQVIFYQKGFTYDVVSNDFDFNVTLVTEVDKKEYFNLFLSAIQ